ETTWRDAERGARDPQGAPFVRSAGGLLARGDLPGGRADQLTALARGEHELAVLEVDEHVLPGVQLAVQDPLAELVLHLVLHRAAQRPGAERRVEPDVDQPLLGG